MTENEQKQKNLEVMLNKGGLVFEFAQPKNIDEPLLLIKNYPKGQRENKINFAFSLIEFYNGTFSFGNKCWITKQDMRPINEQMPAYYPNYREFEYDKKTYFPFSVNLQQYTFEDPNSIRSACRDLYNHIDFQNEQ